MTRWIRPLSWPDGVTPPGFKISHPDLSGAFVIGSPINEVPLDFLGEAAQKRAKYTGRVHKSYPYESADFELMFVLRADKPARTFAGDPYTGISQIDVIELLHKADVMADDFDTPIIYFIAHVEPHGDVVAGSRYEGFGDHEDFRWPVRLAEPPKRKNIGIAAYEYSIKLTIDGKFDETYPYPYTMKEAPNSWRDSLA